MNTHSDSNEEQSTAQSLAAQVLDTSSLTLVIAKQEPIESNTVLDSSPMRCATQSTTSPINEQGEPLDRENGLISSSHTILPLHAEVLKAAVTNTAPTAGQVPPLGTIVIMTLGGLTESITQEAASPINKTEQAIAVGLVDLTSEQEEKEVVEEEEEADTEALVMVGTKQGGVKEERFGKEHV
ncbi:hypothetical protein L218DRAFT_1005076 [Marasmius fiardii PR-910]|nr:hypothetical protein L218DRAFT_1005075 [Marasmius fiardii PR-910]KAF9258424.1 hypothetical protein L218DRAFT_1005076 [Marasmius fiardii PR-910]